MKSFLFVRSPLSFVSFASIASLAFIGGFVGGCGSSDTDGGGTGTDASTSDTGTADTGSTPHVDGGSTPSDASTGDVVTAPDDGSANDTGANDGGHPEGDGATPACSGASDCRLYSSSCDTCLCMALGKNDPDPTCSGTVVTCFVDPCEGKSAKCDNGHCGGN